jgi:hypothetical protein
MLALFNGQAIIVDGILAQEHTETFRQIRSLASVLQNNCSLTMEPSYSAEPIFSGSGQTRCKNGTKRGIRELKQLYNLTLDFEVTEELLDPSQRERNNHSQENTS